LQPDTDIEKKASSEKATKQTLPSEAKKVKKAVAPKTTGGMQNSASKRHQTAAQKVKAWRDANQSGDSGKLATSVAEYVILSFFRLKKAKINMVSYHCIGNLYCLGRSTTVSGNHTWFHRQCG